MQPFVAYSVHGEGFRPLLEAALKAAALQPARAQSGSSSECFLDTFDWRLYKEGLQCRRKGELFELLRLDQKDGKAAAAKPKRPGHAKFAKDFPPGPFRDALAEICGLRALIEVCALFRSFTETKLLDASDKMVAKLRHERVYAEGEPRNELLSFIRVIPVKGYAEEAGRLCEELEARGLPKLNSGHDELRLALGAAGRTPDDYSSSFKAPVVRGMGCREAAAAILLKLIGSMSQNVEGLLNDTDVEFLHDFRVASRRIRAAVAQVKGVFPEPDALKLKRDFASIGRLTNRLRDLDVLLLARAEYEESVPEELRPGLASFFQELEAKRAMEFAKLAQALSAPGFGKTLRRWHDYLEKSASLPKCPNSAVPVEDLAGRFILKRLKRVLKSAEALDEKSPDAEMHALRIECKKLRYLLEFFGPLYEGAGVEKVVGRLKRLQDFLGGLNDLSVQQSFLSGSLSHLPIKGQRSILAAAALGALVARLCESRRKLKGSFSKVFDKFLDSSEYDELKEVFASKRKEE
jgi:CHAD domain-containing protein